MSEQSRIDIRNVTKAFGSVIWYTTYMEARRWYTREPHAAGARTTQGG